VVGLVEVVRHIPRIWREFRKLARAAAELKPDVAVLTDSPDFHLRLAKRLKRNGIPVVYLIAPQAWAWREGRVRTMRATIDRLLAIFPFEPAFFEKHGVPTSYIGHPLARIFRPSLNREEFCRKFNLPADRPIIVLLPGSRQGEVARHMPALLDSARRISEHHDATFVIALPLGFDVQAPSFSEPTAGSSIQVLVGSTWDTLAHSELALAASGTVTIEAALAGVPMVTFYRVNALSWILGRWMVRAPFLSMVNLVAGRRIVPELIQGEMTGKRIAAEAIRLLEDENARRRMRADLAEVARGLSTDADPMEAAAGWIEKVFSARKETVQAV
jgi:lipid-A-disaccharide synthase